MDDGKAAMIVSEDVQKEIESLLQERFNLSEDLVSGGEYEDFLGLRGLLVPRELTYLVYMLEQRYGIRFGMEEYDDPRFYNLSGLSEIVAQLVKEQPQQEVDL